ncbi:hypothetical protein BDQ17DRAFT_1236525, partial [Cyathus striatus]
RWIHEFISNPDFILEHCHKGKKGKSAIDDKDFAQEPHLYLQSVGEYCNLDDIIKYVAGYRWTLQPRGQYMDGHERFDVVYYRASP